jgi:hypothetical protein
MKGQGVLGASRSRFDLADNQAVSKSHSAKFYTSSGQLPQGSYFSLKKSYSKAVMEGLTCPQSWQCFPHLCMDREW